MKVVMQFEVELDAENLIDAETFQAEFDSDWFKYLSWLYAEEGIFWDETLELRAVYTRGDT